MAGGKETPRQRMMGILYLVLLGLVALSVPDNLLDAFKNIRSSLDLSTGNVKKGISDTYSSFAASKKDQEARTAPILKKAKEATAISDALDKYVEALRDTLVAAGGGINPSTNDVSARENLDISARLMINQKKGEVLKDKIEETRNQLMALLSDKEKQGVNFSLNAVAPKVTVGPQKTWEEAYFGDGIPLGATLTTLAKIQTDTKNAESEVVKKILGEADQAVVTLDTFQGVAVAPSSYIIQGQPYTADIFLTAYDSKSNPTITINGSPIPVANGKGKYTVNTSTEGIVKYSGSIVVKDPNGGPDKHYDIPQQTYQVSRPSAVVSPTKMNVLYIGLPNPLAVSAPGIPKEALSLSMSGGSISGKNGEYTATVSSPGEAKVNVSATIGGKTTQLGTNLFRIKRIPDPVAEFAGTSGGTQNTATIQGQSYIFATLKDFQFDTKFNVKSYKITIIRPRQDAVTTNGYGNALSPEVKSKLKLVSPGTRIIIDDIYAVGPDKTDRLLNSISIKAN